MATALQTVEMAVHTAAMVDAGHLAAGHATPVLTTHLAMSMVFYPLFGIATAAFFIKGMRERAIGSPWIVWIGVIGTVANGIAPILVGLFGWTEARILFAFMVGIAIWLLLAAVWPTSALRAWWAGPRCRRRATAGRPATPQAFRRYSRLRSLICPDVRARSCSWSCSPRPRGRPEGATPVPLPSIAPLDLPRLLDLYAEGASTRPSTSVARAGDEIGRHLRRHWDVTGRQWIDADPAQRPQRILVAAALALETEHLRAERGDWRVTDDPPCAAACVLDWAQLQLVERRRARSGRARVVPRRRGAGRRRSRLALSAAAGRSGAGRPGARRD